MGNLSIGEVFIRYDGPRLFECRNDAGQRFLALSVDDRDESDVYLYVPVSGERYLAVRSGALPLRTAFTDPEDDFVYVVRQPFVSEKADVERIHASALPEDW